MARRVTTTRAIAEGAPSRGVLGALHLRRMKPQTPTIRPPTPTEATVTYKAAAVAPDDAVTGLSPVGNRHAQIVVPQHWRFVVLDPREDPMNEAFSRTKGNHWVSSEQELDTLLDAIDRASAIAMDRASLLADDIDRAEHDEWPRITVLRGRVPSSALLDLTPPRITIPASWKRIADQVCRAVAQAAGGDRVPERPPADTNVGWPFFSSGSPGLKIAAAACGVGGTPEEVTEDAAECGRVLGLPPITTLAYGESFRGGQIKDGKEITRYKPAGGGIWEAEAVITNAAQRDRQVFMAPSSLLHQLEPMYGAIRAGLSRLPGLTRAPWNPGDDPGATTIIGSSPNTIGAALSLDEQILVTATRRGLKAYESDISRYDLSVSRDLQEALADALIRAFKDSTDVIRAVRLWLAAEGRPVIGPSTLGGGPGTATVVTSEGATHSGLITTAIIATVICFITELWSQQEDGHTKQPVKDWLQGTLLIADQGDDILKFMRDGIDTESSTLTWARVGLKCEVTKGARFLKQLFTQTPTRRIAARIIQGTFFPEHPPEVPVDRSDAILAIGLWARYGPIGPGDKYVDLIRGLIEPTRLGRLGITDGPTAAAWLRTPEGVRQTRWTMNHLSATPYADRLKREAQHSPAAAQLWLALQGFGLQCRGPLIGDAEVHAASQRARRLSRPARLDLIRSTWDVAAGYMDPSVDRVAEVLRHALSRI